MTGQVHRAIGVRVVKGDSHLLDVADLAPLLMPTEELLETIADQGGPLIDAHAVRRGEHSLILAALDGTLVLLSCLCEETADLDETKLLVGLRRRELAAAFQRMMGYPDLLALLQHPGDGMGLTAALLLTVAVEMAGDLETRGNYRRELSGYTFSVVHLSVWENGDAVRFEVVPSDAVTPRLGAMLH